MAEELSAAIARLQRARVREVDRTVCATVERLVPTVRAITAQVTPRSDHTVCLELLELVVGEHPARPADTVEQLDAVAGTGPLTCAELTEQLHNATAHIRLDAAWTSPYRCTFDIDAYTTADQQQRTQSARAELTTCLRDVAAGLARRELDRGQLEQVQIVHRQLSVRVGRRLKRSSQLRAHGVDAAGRTVGLEQLVTDAARFGLKQGLSSQKLVATRHGVRVAALTGDERA